MADNFDPAEVERLFAERDKVLKNGGKITAQMAKDLKDAETGLKNYADRVNQSLKALGRSAMGLAGAVKDGKTGFSAYNDAISSTADVVANVASKFGLLGAALGMAAKATGEYTKAVNKQADALSDAYKDMAKAGLTGADGMSGVFKKMQKFGYGIEELDKMSGLLRENTDTLSLLGDTVEQGTEQFANLASSIQRSGAQTQLMKMGMSIDDINKGAIGFMRLQTSIGRGRLMTGDQLRESSLEYIRETDALRKITGQTQEQQEEQLKQAYAESAFNQTMFELDEQATAGDQAAKEQAAKLREIMLSKLPKEVKDELKRAVGGDYAAAEKVAKIAPRALGMIMNKQGTAADTIDMFRDEIKTNLLNRGQQAKLNTYGEDYSSMKEQREFVASLGDKSWNEIKKDAKEAQVVTDDLSKNAVDLKQAQLNTRDGMQSMLQKGIIPVTNAVAELGKAAGMAVTVPSDLAAPTTAGKIAPEAKPPAVAPKVSGMEDIKKMVMAHEGVRYAPYKDTKGLWTVGVGHLIGDGKTLPANMNRQFSEKEVMDMFESDFAKHVRIAEQTPGYNKANETGKGAFIDLAFNMGKWWPKFPNTSKALASGDFKAAAAGLRDSAWYKQVGNRGPKIVSMVAAAGTGYKDGGIPTGPNSGYTTTLHGTEAVIPMKENKKMPINVTELTAGLAKRTELFDQYINKINRLITIASSNVDISQKIFRQAH
jgi:lysozyme